MSSTALSVYPHLPPTSNLLNSQQRTRLIRSTRKLGAVLGTTPYLLEHDTAFTILPLGKTTSRVLKRQGSIFTHKQPSSSSITSTSTTSSQFPSPSTSSVNLPRSIIPGTQSTESRPTNPPGLSSSQKRRPRDKPPQLYLQLNTIPLAPVNDCFASSLSPPPTPYASPPTPTTPTTPVPDLIEIRRKRMAKLARHLGEKIPLELVLTPEPVTKPATVPPDLRPGRYFQPVQVMRDEAVRICDNRPPLGQSRPKQEWVGEWNRSNISDVQQELRNLKFR